MSKSVPVSQNPLPHNYFIIFSFFSTSEQKINLAGCCHGWPYQGKCFSALAGTDGSSPTWWTRDSSIAATPLPFILKILIDLQARQISGHSWCRHSFLGSDKESPVFACMWFAKISDGKKAPSASPQWHSGSSVRVQLTSLTPPLSSWSSPNLREVESNFSSLGILT